MNFDRLRFVAEGTELDQGREALLSVDIPVTRKVNLLSQRQPCSSNSVFSLCLQFHALHPIIHPHEVAEFVCLSV